MRNRLRPHRVLTMQINPNPSSALRALAIERITAAYDLDTVTCPCVSTIGDVLDDIEREDGVGRLR